MYNGYEMYIFIFIFIYYLIYLNAYDVIEPTNIKQLYYQSNNNVLPILIWIFIVFKNECQKATA